MSRLTLSLLVTLITATLGGAPLVAQTNDNFATRTVLTGSAFTSIPVANNAATIEPGEPSAHNYRSLWYTWTAPSDLRVTLSKIGSTGSSLRMFVYFGNSLANLCPVRSTGDQTITWTAVKGVTYQIAVDCSNSYSSNFGDVTLSLSSSPFPGNPVGPDVPTSAAPANDNFDAAKELTGLPLTLIAMNGGATREPAEPQNGSKTVWYSYTAGADEWLNIAVESSFHGPWISVYRGDSLDTLQLLASDGQTVRVAVPKGVTYRISISNYYSYNDENLVQLALRTTAYASSGTIVGPDQPTGNAPLNDNFGARKELSGPKLSIFGYNTQATRESFEPASSPHRSLWYSWGTDTAGSVKITIGGVGLSSQSLSVYTGGDITSLKSVTLTKVSGSAADYTFSAQAHVSYSIALGSYYSYSDGGLVGFDLAGPGAGVSAIPSLVVNISTRTTVAGGGSAIAGFVVNGKAKKQLLIQAVGPQLRDYGVTNAMADPNMTLMRMANGVGTPIGSNDNWSSNTTEAAAVRAARAATGAQSTVEGGKDAAMVVLLDPGVYTAVVRDGSAVGGDVVVEVNDVP